MQIIGRNKFSIRFESLCWILRLSPQIRVSQNQAKSNYKDCSFGNRDSFVKGTRLSVLILAKSQAGRKFEVLEAACLVSISQVTQALWEIYRPCDLCSALCECCNMSVTAAVA